jgi:hypothetical protein
MEQTFNKPNTDGHVQAIPSKESDYQRSHWSCAISKESSQDPKW